MKLMMKRMILASVLTFGFLSCSNEPKENVAATVEDTLQNTETAPMKGAIELSEQEYAQFVDDYKDDKWQYMSDKPCLIDFYAVWCGPCKRLSPVVNAIADKYDGRVYVYKVNVDEAPALSQALGVRSIPMLMFVPVNGTPEIITGFLSQEQLEQKLKVLLK